MRHPSLSPTLFLSLSLPISLSVCAGAVRPLQDLYVIELQRGTQFELTNITNATHRVESSPTLVRIRNSKLAKPALKTEQ